MNSSRLFVSLAIWIYEEINREEMKTESVASQRILLKGHKHSGYTYLLYKLYLPINHTLPFQLPDLYDLQPHPDAVG